jgi:hypothetical protein
MESKKTGQPAPQAGQRKPGTGQDGKSTPTQAAYARPTGKPNSEGPAVRPPDEIEAPGKTPSPATADDELQQTTTPLEEVEGLTDNKAGG